MACDWVTPSRFCPPDHYGPDVNIEYYYKHFFFEFVAPEMHNPKVENDILLSKQADD